MWDPVSYLRYGDERGRPFVDLLARVGAERPRTVVDLGCGPGTLTVTLAARWPDARVVGLDSSSEMVDRARALESTVDFRVGDVRDWAPEPGVDVVVSNAALHWLSDHERLLVGWARRLDAGAWLAVQVPGNADAPSHVALRATAARPRWRDKLADATAPRRVPDPGRYAEMLTAAGCAVDAWETTYVHLLNTRGPAAGHPVLDWMEGTALRPVRAALDDADWSGFRAELAERLAEAYPVVDGTVYFPFRRVFAVARANDRKGQP